MILKTPMGIVLSGSRQSSIFDGLFCGQGPVRKLRGIGCSFLSSKGGGGGSVNGVISKPSGGKVKESRVFLKSDISELILNSVFGSNVTKTVKSRANIMTIFIELLDWYKLRQSLLLCDKIITMNCVVIILQESRCGTALIIIHTKTLEWNEKYLYSTKNSKP